MEQITVSICFDYRMVPGTKTRCELNPSSYKETGHSGAFESRIIAAVTIYLQTFAWEMWCDNWACSGLKSDA